MKKGIKSIALQSYVFVLFCHHFFSSVNSHRETGMNKRSCLNSIGDKSYESYVSVFIFWQEGEAWGWQLKMKQVIYLAQQ